MALATPPSFENLANFAFLSGKILGEVLPVGKYLHLNSDGCGLENFRECRNRGRLSHHHPVLKTNPPTHPCFSGKLQNPPTPPPPCFQASCKFDETMKFTVEPSVAGKLSPIGRVCPDQHSVLCQPTTKLRERRHPPSQLKTADLFSASRLKRKIDI